MVRMKLQKLLQKIIITFGLMITLASAAYANLACVTQGDFWPFPWSDQGVSQVVGQQWPLVNLRNQVESKIVIEQVDVYFTTLPIYLVQEYALDDRLLSLGTAWHSGDDRHLTFKMYNVTNHLEETYDHMTIRFGAWSPKKIMGPVQEGTQQDRPPLYDVPIGDYILPQQFDTLSCPGFTTSQRAEVFGLVIEKDTTWGAERKDIFFSFEPISL